MPFVPNGFTGRKCPFHLCRYGGFSAGSPSPLLLAQVPALQAAPPEDTFLRDYAETRGFMLGRPVNATPTPDGTAVLFLRAKSAREPSQELYEFTVASAQTRRLLAPEDALKGAAERLSPEEKARRERQRISVGGFTAFSISRDSALVLLQLSGQLYVLSRADGGVRALATGAGTIVDPKFSPDSRSVAYVRGQDVYVFDLATGRERAVTAGGTETVSHGLAEFVAQEEMARYAGFWWSPDSRRIAYQESDASKVETWYPADPAQPGNPPQAVFYPRPGKENVSVRVGVVPVDDPGKTVWLDYDRAKYSYLGKVTWKEEGPLTLTVLSRDQTDLALLTAEPDTGKTRVLLSEHDDAWVNLPQDVPVWLSGKDGGGFLWASERSGSRELEKRASTGLPERMLTSDQGPQHFLSLSKVTNGYASVVVGALPTGTFVASIPLQGEPALKNIYCPSGNVGTGLVQVNFGDCPTIFTDQVQGTDGILEEEPETVIQSAADNSPIGVLPSVAVAQPAAPMIEFTKAGATGIEEFYQGKGSFAVIIRPRSFEVGSKTKYPVIVDVYGGPGHQQVVASMRPYLLDQWLADQGFIVVAIDGRGTPGRGHGWERAIAGHFGSVPLDDQIAALKFLGTKHSEMDMDRVGITGWSFGGYMAALAVLRRPDVFKAAVAGAPVTDWMDYDTCYTERYLGVPGDGRYPDAYKESSLLTYAADLSRPLLLIHGTADDNVYFRHSLKLEEAFFRAGKEAEFLPLNSFTHMVPDPVVRTRLEERIARFFQQHLAQP